MSLTIDSSKFEAALKSLGQITAKRGRRIMGTYSAYLEEQINARAPRGLARSFRGSHDATRAVVGSNKPYARIRHFGGTIYPSGSPNYRPPAPPLPNRRGSLSEVTGKPIKHLVIPIHPAAKNKRPRDFQQTFIKPIGGKALICQRIGAEGFGVRSGSEWRTTGTKSRARRGDRARGFRVLFLLVPSVRIPGTGYANLTPQDEARFGEIILEEAQGLLEQA